MLLSRSTGRKVSSTATAAVAFASCTRVTILDSRYATRELELRDSDSPPVARGTAPIYGHRLLQGHHDGVRGERPDRDRRRGSRAAAGRLGHPGRQAGRPLQRHLHDHGHRAGRPGPPHRHLHVELQRGAGARPPRGRASRSSGSAGIPSASTPRLVDRLFRQREARLPTQPPRHQPSRSGGA